MARPGRCSGWSDSPGAQCAGRLRQIASRRNPAPNDLNTLLTALYVDLDDRVLPALGWSREHRPGRKPALSDAELACVAVA